MLDTHLLTVVWPAQPDHPVAEIRWGHDFCRRQLENALDSLGIKYVWRDASTKNTLDLGTPGVREGYCLIVNEPLLFIPVTSIQDMLNGVKEHPASIVGPLLNATSVEQQRAEIARPYLSLSSFLEAARRRHLGDREFVSVSELDPACFLSSSEVFLKVVRTGGFPVRSLEKKTLPKDVELLISTGSLVHLFDNFYGNERPDLLALVPEHVRTVLDIGCAYGGYGRALKRERPAITLTGIEQNPMMAEQATVFYDEVISSRVEQAQFKQKFDLINCGDVLEHIEEPWNFLNQCSEWLEPKGHLVLSIPNAAYWNIVKDLLDDRFDYIPLGPTCITHLRWFTRQSITELLEDSGFTVEVCLPKKLPPPPEGEAFIAALTKAGLGERETLLAHELVIRAGKNV